jgi:6-phosphofructokinase 2
MLVETGRRLFDRYRIEVIALSMGPDALLVTRNMAKRANGLPVEAVSVSGAGDSFLGAMLWSLVKGDSLEIALRYGVAGGSAALLNPGTELCRSEDVHRLASGVVVTPIARNSR